MWKFDDRRGRWLLHWELGFLRFKEWLRHGPTCFEEIETIVHGHLVEQGGVYSIYYRVLYSLPEGGL